MILAVGFGLERRMEPISFRSYWEDDSLHQGMTLPGREMHVFVSGTGDGGLIDTLRICLRDFDQGNFLHALTFRLRVDHLENLGDCGVAAGNRRYWICALEHFEEMRLQYRVNEMKGTIEELGGDPEIPGGALKSPEVLAEELKNLMEMDCSTIIKS